MSVNEIKFNGETIGITQVDYKMGDSVMHPKIIKYQVGDDDVNAKVVWREPYNLNIIKDDSITSIKYKIDGGTPVETLTSTDVIIGYGQKYSYIVTYDANIYSNILKENRPAETWEEAKEYEMTENVTINPKVVPYKTLTINSEPSGSANKSSAKVTRTSHISNYDIADGELSSGAKVYKGDSIKVEISIGSDLYGEYKLVNNDTKVEVGSDLQDCTTYYATKGTPTTWKATNDSTKSSGLIISKTATVKLNDELFNNITVSRKSSATTYRTVYWGEGNEPQTGWTRDGDGEINVLNGVESAVNYIPLTNIKVNGFVYYGSAVQGNSHQLGGSPLTVEGLSTGDFTIPYGGYKWTFSISQKSSGSSTLVLRRIPPKPKGEYKSIAKLTVYQYPQ